MLCARAKLKIRGRRKLPCRQAVFETSARATRRMDPTWDLQAAHEAWAITLASLMGLVRFWIAGCFCDLRRTKRMTQLVWMCGFGRWLCARLTRSTSTSSSALWRVRLWTSWRAFAMCLLANAGSDLNSVRCDSTCITDFWQLVLMLPASKRATLGPILRRWQTAPFSMQMPVRKTQLLFR